LRAAIVSGDSFVHGNDWTYDLIQANQASTDWLESQKAGVLDVARFLGCPGDLIDAEVNSGTKITYANITQRHLQFLITHLRPAIRRREGALSETTQSPRFVKLDTDDLLAMDPETRASYLRGLIEGRIIAPSEAREVLGKAPFTDAQLDEFLLLFPTPALPLVPVPGQPAPPPQPAAISGGDGEAPQ